VSDLRVATPGSRATTVCFGLIVALLLVYTAAAVIVRPSLYPDPAWGLLGADSARRFGASVFAHSMFPDAADIAKDKLAFGTGWSPGQHLLPLALESAGFGLGVAMALVTAAVSALGLVGWFTLYRAFRFPATTCAVAVVLIACSRFFGLGFSIYTGGELLLFGAAPWFALLVWRLRDLRWAAVPALLAGAVVLFFAKLSGIMFAGGTIGAAALAGERARVLFGAALVDTLRKLLVAGVTIATIGIVFYFAWLRRGWTPVAAASAAQIDPRVLIDYSIFALGAAWTAALSLGDLANWLVLHPARPLLAGPAPVWYALAVPAAVSFAIMAWRLRPLHAEYLRFVGWASLAIGAVLVASCASGASIGMDERHMRPVALLLLVGLVETVRGFGSRMVRWPLAAVGVLSAVYGVTAFAQRERANLQRPLGVQGFRQIEISAPALDYVWKIDQSTRPGDVPLIYLTTPEAALEVRRARVLAKHADGTELADLAQLSWHGRVGRLYVVMPRRLLDNGKAEAILRSFVDYRRDAWRTEQLGDFVAFWQAGGG